MTAYTTWIVDAELRELLGSAGGALVIEGPKACAQVLSATPQAASHVLLDIDQASRQALVWNLGWD